MKKTHTVIGAKLRKEMAQDPEYLRCSITTLHACRGRITREHAIIVAGKKVQKRWAIIPACAAAHGVDQFQDAGTEVPKAVRRWVALNRATDEELLEYPKANLLQERGRLNAQYGIYVPPEVPAWVGIRYE